MAGKLRAHRQALVDQILAALDDLEGFPVSTRDLADRLGDRLIGPGNGPLLPRPSCWPEDLPDDRHAETAFCHRCRTPHRLPVWRSYSPDDIRTLLDRLAAAGDIQKISLRGYRSHYWRRSGASSGKEAR